MEQTITILIYIHAFLGGIGLLSGIASIIMRKGSGRHKRLGRIFSYSMVLSAGLSLIIARMPGHHNMFLFLIGTFTIYLVLAGNRALTFTDRHKSRADMLDKSISAIMLLASIVMVVLGVIALTQGSTGGVLYLFFGAFGVLLTIGDLQSYRSPSSERTVWLKSHLGRMVGALIASITAFLVAGLDIGTLLVWVSPTILGTAYIIYWSRKVDGRLRK